MKSNTSGNTFSFMYSIQSQYNSSEIEELLRKKIPGRNEKYYLILLTAGNQLLNEDFKVALTVNDIITESGLSRPTWYSYFNDLEDFYFEVVNQMGKLIMEFAIRQYVPGVKAYNWFKVIIKSRLHLLLSSTREIVDCFPKLKKYWNEIYSMVIQSFSETLYPILSISYPSCLKMLKNIMNEFILHSNLYNSSHNSFDQFVRKKYQFFTSQYTPRTERGAA